MWKPSSYPEDVKRLSSLAEHISALEDEQSVAPLVRNTLASLERQFDLAWERLRAKRLADWPGAVCVANQIEKRLRRATRRAGYSKVKYRRFNAHSGTVYFYLNGRKLRISDHDSHPEGGGFHYGWGMRRTGPDIDLTPFSGVSCSEAIDLLLERKIVREELSYRLGG